MAFRSSALGSSAAGGTITATPAGAAVDDYLSGIVATDSGSLTPTSPTGWVERVNNDQGAPDGARFRFADKIAVGSDSFTWDAKDSGNSYVINSANSGRNTSTPRTANTGEQNTTANASPVAVSHTGVTAANGDDVLVYMQLDQTAGVATWNFSQITNYTERQDDTALDWVTVAMDSRDNVSAGATGALDSTATLTAGTGNAGWGVIVVAIAASAGGATQAKIWPSIQQGILNPMIGRRYV